MYNNFETPSPYPTKNYLPSKKIMMFLAGILFLATAFCFGGYLINGINDTNTEYMSSEMKTKYYLLVASLGAMTIACMGIGFYAFSFGSSNKPKKTFAVLSVIALIGSVVYLYAMTDSFEYLDEIDDVMTFSWFVTPIITALMMLIGSSDSVKGSGLLAVVPAICAIMFLSDFKEIISSLMDTIDYAEKYGYDTTELYIELFRSSSAFLLPIAATFLLVGMHETNAPVASAPVGGAPFNNSTSSTGTFTSSGVADSTPSQTYQSDSVVNTTTQAFTPDSSSFNQSTTFEESNPSYPGSEQPSFESTSSTTARSSSAEPVHSVTESTFTPTPAPESAPEQPSSSLKMSSAFKKADNDPFK